MLFVTVVEALHALVEKANPRRLKFVYGELFFEVSHLQFAGDTILFCNASLHEVDNLKSILRWYEFKS